MIGIAESVGGPNVAFEPEPHAKSASIAFMIATSAPPKLAPEGGLSLVS